MHLGQNSECVCNSKYNTVVIIDDSIGFRNVTLCTYWHSACNAKSEYLLVGFPSHGACNAKRIFFSEIDK